MVMMEPTPTPTAAGNDLPLVYTPEPGSGDDARSNLGSAPGTTATAVGGVSLVTLAIIAIAIIAPALIIIMVVRRRAASSDQGFETMPPTTQENTYSGQVRRNDNFSVGDE